MWSEDEFQRRCHQRAADLGVSLRKLLDRVGLGHATMDRVTRSRRIDTLEKIGHALHWTLAEVLGLSVGRVSPDTLEIAFGLAEEALQPYSPPPRLIIRETARAYNVLQAGLRDGTPIDDPVLHSAIRRMIAEVWQEDPPPHSRQPGEPTAEAGAADGARPPEQE